MMNAGRTRARVLAVTVAAFAALCAGLLAPVQPAFAASFFMPVFGAGSTWSYNAIHAWTTNVAQSGMIVNYSPVGSTVGRSEFKQGAVQWAASDIPYGVGDGSNLDPPPARGYAYVPDTAGGTTFMYNLHVGGQRVTGLRLSGAVIAGIFTNQITMWNDPMIAADNPGVTLPAERIIPVVRSDGSGSTAQFTQWMIATQGSYWTSYCKVAGRDPCTQTSIYPVQAGTAMIRQLGDLGVSSYVSRAQAEGAIGYVQYSYALQAGFPVAKVLNAAGYYTQPTPGHVAVSLLQAQINMDQTSPLYLTQDLSQVYTDTDPRTYELSSYSYMIVPTTSDVGLISGKGRTLGAFGSYALCQGQQQVDALGYSALPVNLVQAGFAQLQKIPGASVPTPTTDFIKSCDNPTFSPDGTNALADNDPMPPACDKQGATPCSTGAVNTTTTLTAAPDPATVGQAVTLTATEVAADGTNPAGSVQFEDGGTAIGSPAAVNSSGVATTTTAFAAAGTQSLSAVFTPADTTGFNSSTGTFRETVQAAGGSSGSEPLAVTISASGSFTLTVPSGTVDLTVSGSNAAGALNPIMVSDTRNTAPGWSVSGQVADFTGTGTGTTGGTISGNQLGWAPDDTSLAAGAALGPVVAPGSPGLGTTPAVLASAQPGSGTGTSALGANLTLAIPAAPQPGGYTSSLTVTAVTTLP